MTYEDFEGLCARYRVKPADITRATGITSSTLSAWKRGTYTPKQTKMQAIEDFFRKLRNESQEAQQDVYYEKNETAAAAQDIFDDPYMRILFDAAKDSRPEDLLTVANLLKRLKETNPDG